MTDFTATDFTALLTQRLGDSYDPTLVKDIPVLSATRHREASNPSVAIDEYPVQALRETSHFAACFYIDDGSSPTYIENMADLLARSSIAIGRKIYDVKTTCSRPRKDATLVVVDLQVI